MKKQQYEEYIVKIIEVVMNTLAVVAGLLKTGGGTSYSVPLWSNSLAREQVQRTLMTVQFPGEENCDFVDQGMVQLITIPGMRIPSTNISWSPGFQKKLLRFCEENKIELIHNHGIWLPVNHTASVVSRKLGIPLVVTLHGMLTLWSFNYKRWKKRLAWWLYQKNDLQTAKVVHVTSQLEADDLRTIGFRGPVALIPNGIDIPEIAETPDTKKEYRTALFVSRIHPKKGLLNLVQAWSVVKPKGWRMMIIGPDEMGHLEEVRRAVQENGLEDSFVFRPFLYREELSNLYRKSDLFILPTFSENFGLVVPEALSYGIPVITTHGTPWKELEDHSCGWWIPLGVQPLVGALREATELTDSQRREMGKRGRELVINKYNWDSVGKQMKTLYEWVLGGGTKPPFLMNM